MSVETSDPAPACSASTANGRPSGSTPTLPPNPDPRTRARLSRIAQAMAAVCVLTGGLALIGHLIGSPMLSAWGAGLVTMGPGASLAIILAGCGLWLVRTHEGRPLSVLGRVCGLVVAVLGVRSLAADLAPAAGSWTVLEAWLRSGAWEPARRLSVATATGLILGGLGILLSGRRWGLSRFALLLSLGVLLVAIVGLIGLAYRVTPVEGGIPLLPTSLPAAFAFLALAIGLMAEHADNGPIAVLTSDGEGGFLARRLLPATILVPTILGWLLLRGVWRGWYHSELATAALALACAIFFFGLVWRYASVLNRAEAQSKRADAALRESEAFYHSLVETLPQSILRKNAEGRFTFANSKVLAALGVTSEQFVGKTDYDFYPAELAEKYRNDDLRVMEAGEPIDVVEEHVEPGGDLRYVQVIKTPLRDQDDRVVGVQCIFWDVTERKIAEEKLQTQNTLLTEMALSERAAHEERKKAQSQLIQSAKLAGLGEMVAGVAHEINNPLSFVSNNVAVLQRDLGELRALLTLYGQADPLIAHADGELSRRIAEFREANDLDYTLTNLDGLLARTRDGLRRIQQIVKDLRVFARIDTSEIAEFDLNESIQTTLTIISGHAKKKRVSMETDLRPVPCVTGYAAKINQVLMNLVGNAIDACREGGRVLIQTAPDERGGGVRLEVVDDGHGIPPEIKDRIFDPFFTTKPVGVGTGLGLSISYGIVQDHGGTIEVESSPGQGARFVVRLPQKGCLESRARTAASADRGDPGETRPILVS